MTTEILSGTEEFRTLAKDIGYGVWNKTFMTDFPDASPEEKKAAWGEAREQQQELGKEILRRMERKGYKVSMSAAASGSFHRSR